MDSAWQVLRMLVGFVAVLALALWGTRLLGRRAGPTSGGRYLRLVEVISVGQNRMLCLVKVGSRYELIGLADRSVSSIGRYEDLEPIEGDEPGGGVRGQILRDLGRRARLFRPRGEGNGEA